MAKVSRAEFDQMRRDLRRISHNMDYIGQAAKKIDMQTAPAIGWLPALLISAAVVFPGVSAVKDAGEQYTFVAPIAGLVLDAEQWTGTQFFNLGIRAMGGSTTYLSPLDTELMIVDQFGRRTHPIAGVSRQHNSTDYQCAVGDTVRAIRGGTIEAATNKPETGNTVVIKHADGSRSMYAHLNSIAVEAGDGVASREKIGECGNTGTTQGTRLALTIKNPQGDFIDPALVVDVLSPVEMWEFFRNTVAQTESQGSGDYYADNGVYRGRYQMGKAALQTVGMYPHPNGWDGFKSDPAYQERAYHLWQRKNLHAGLHGLTLPSGERLQPVISASDPAWKVAAYLKASQFGVANAMRWMGQGKEFYDGNNKPISEMGARAEKAFKAKYGWFSPATPLINAINAEPGERTLAAQGSSMTVASQYLGLHERRDRQVLANLVGFDPTGAAWCAGFVNAVLDKTGSQGTGKLTARSFLEWGEKTTTPRKGDIVVLWRVNPRSWQGHVGFFAGFTADGDIKILGGNQDNRVSIEAYPKSRLISYRRASSGLLI